MKFQAYGHITVSINSTSHKKSLVKRRRETTYFRYVSINSTSHKKSLKELLNFLLRRQQVSINSTSHKKSLVIHC